MDSRRHCCLWPKSGGKADRYTPQSGQAPGEPRQGRGGGAWVGVGVRIYRNLLNLWVGWRALERPLSPLLEVTPKWFCLVLCMTGKF